MGALVRYSEPRGGAALEPDAVGTSKRGPGKARGLDSGAFSHEMGFLLAIR